MFLRRTLFGGLVVFTLCRPALGWGSAQSVLGISFLRDRRLTVVLSTLTPWVVEGLVARGGPYWPELSPGDSWERDGVEG